jgi:hypothetical protein
MRISEKEFDTNCKWIDSRHVMYQGKRYKVLGYRAGYMELAEI